MQNSEDYSLHDGVAVAQVRQLVSCTWEGSRVAELKGTLSELYGQIPIFSRHPFRSGGQENRYKDEIRREPLKIAEDPLPIATVSKTYALIQHRDLLSSMFRALRSLGIDVSELECTIYISEYGERMQWNCAVPNVDFDPGDGHPIVLRVNCLNSVDMTTVLEITLTWFRLICANGLMFGIRDSLLRRRHIQSLDPEHIASYLSDQLQQAAPWNLQSGLGIHVCGCRLQPGSPEESGDSSGVRTGGGRPLGRQTCGRKRQRKTPDYRIARRRRRGLVARRTTSLVRVGQPKKCQ